MKLKLLTFFIAASIILAACSSSRTARKYDQQVGGNWQLETITTEGITGNVKVTLFNEADFNCFIGSTWNFKTGNNLGTYNLSSLGSGCSALQRDFRWSIYEPATGIQQLQFKKLDINKKEILDDTGYRFTILQLNNNMMQLKEEISFEGRPAAFIFNFIKLN